jgi:hypothetical protein
VDAMKSIEYECNMCGNTRIVYGGLVDVECDVCGMSMEPFATELPFDEISEPYVVNSNDFVFVLPKEGEDEY